MMGFSDLNKPKKYFGADNVQIDGPNSTFGEVATISVRPQAQGDFVYGVNDQIFTTSSFVGGTVTSVSGVCELDSGTNASGSATVQLRRGLKYRPGQGSMMRATALFSEPDAGNAQFVGAGNGENGYFIGYFGTNFGILHSERGQREVRKLTVLTGSGTGNVTVTLNGNSIVVPITGGSDTSQTAYQLSIANYSQLGSGGWLADAIGNTVYFISARSSSTLTGSYSVAGASIVGTFSRTKAGEAQTNTFIPSASFNRDRLDGKGPSGMTLNPQRGNVYELQFQYLGYGNAEFSVENPENGKFTKIHTIENANNRTTPVLKNPNVSVLATSANIGGTTSKKLKTASMAGFIEGTVVKLDPKFAKGWSFSGVNSATYRPLALLKANRLHNDESCFGEFDLLRIGASNEVNNKTLTVGFFKKAKISGDVNYQYVDEQNSIVSYASLTPTGAGLNTITNLAEITPFFELIVGSASSRSINLEDLEYILGPGDELLIAIRTTASITGQVSITWFEQQ